ncbi:hypothetical protein DFH27DRAFT_64185 [Peziza echinospora]|nr:hypothetical protein DFH27DRAFT_64185 [Peziza echinospora]
MRNPFSVPSSALLLLSIPSIVAAINSDLGNFTVHQIPDIKGGALPLLKLDRNPVRFSTKNLEDLLKPSCGKLDLRKSEDGQRLSAFEGERLAAYIDSESGETEVFPTLDALKPSNYGNISGLATRTASSFFGGGIKDNLIPPDSTKFRLDTPAVLVASKQLASEKGSKRKPVVAEYLATVPVARSVNGYDVIGTGSKASVSVGADGQIYAFSHRWRAAWDTEKVVKAYPKDRILEQILNKIRCQLKEHHKVTIKKVDIVYYDGELEYLQPVYRYVAETIGFEFDQASSNIQSEGYVPIGDFVEPIPEPGAQEAPVESSPPDDFNKRALTPPWPFTVGRYVVRQDYDGFVRIANRFWNLLSGESAKSTLYAPKNTQYYWAYNYMYLQQAANYVDSVHLALTAGHGAHGVFSTLKNCCDLVWLNDVIALGKKNLRYWVIYACSVIPTSLDSDDPFGPWWNVFGGLHTVVGYRTIAFLEDGVPEGFAKKAAWGGSASWSWMSSASASSSYGATKTYWNEEKKRWDRYGRPSAVSVCGHIDDSLGRADKLNPTCLHMWWYI